MIPAGVDVFVSVAPIDLRWGFERLGGIAAEYCGRDVRSRALFVFFGRHRRAVKILYFDGTGLCLWYKRLDRGVFRALDASTSARTSWRVSDTELTTLLADIVPQAAPVPRRVH